MTKAKTLKVQLACNRFTDKYLDNVARLRVDGDYGSSTVRRVRECKIWLGYTAPISGQAKSVTDLFLKRMVKPGSPNLSSEKMIVRGKLRRRRQQAEQRKPPTAGVGVFDGRKVANIGIPHLRWAREDGWPGWLASGWRDPDYSEQLCIDMCGRPSCPGKCAGKASNHVGTTRDRFAVDVTHYEDFARRMRRCPHEPRISNALGSRDPVHFSPSGR